MPRYYKVRLPKRIASQWAKSRPPSEGDDSFVVQGDPGVTFRVSDIQDGRVPTESTVEGGIDGVVHQEVGLSDAEAAELIAHMAVAERASQPDRLPLVVALVCALLAAILASGIPQAVVDTARANLIEERVNKPRAQYGWSARVGATKKSLGLDGNKLNIPHEKPASRFFPSFR